MSLVSDVRLSVIAVGARSPLGLNSLQGAMCARARKLEPRETDLVDGHGHGAGVCLAVGVPPEPRGFDRLVAIAAPALHEAHHAIEVEHPLPLVLALPEQERPDNDPRLSTELLPALAARSGVPIDLARSQLVRVGNAGGAVAIEAAAAMLVAGAAPAVIVGGVDSYYHPAVIAQLDEGARLHAIGVENGFIPGEGAAFAVLALEGALRREAPRSARDPAASARGAPAHGRPRAVIRGRSVVCPGGPVATVVSVRTGLEETVGTDQPNLAAAMTQIVRHVIVASGRGSAAWVLSDLNGERHRLKEWEKVAARVPLARPAVHQRLPDEMGDLGAATGIMILAVASVWWRAGCAAQPALLGALHSEGPERGGFFVEQAS